MMNNISNLKPQNVWKHFYALTQIPRPSGHSEKITTFIENFGKNLGLETTRDAANNICIRKPATPGYENRQTIILQSHLDMVPQANSDLKFDFAKDAMLNQNARLISIQGGTLRNAIPREAFATIVVDGETNYQSVLKLVDYYRDIFNNEFDGIENVIELKAERQTVPTPLQLIPLETQRKLTHAIASCPNGVVNMFAKIPDTVETSVNMAIVQSGDGSIEVKFLARSSSESKKQAICSSIESVFINAGANQVASGNGYPGWNPNPDSDVLQIMKKTFEAQRGYTPKVEVMHAGLECGIILSSVPGLDTVSFGPTIQFPHSPDEKLEIASVQKFWDFLTGILKEAPKK
jgi:dipeptidase D